MAIVSAYLHALHGRLRIKIPEIKRAPFEARKLEHTFRGMRGMTTVQANPQTGNVLFLFEPTRCSPDDIISHLREGGHCQRFPDATPHAGPV